MRDIASHIASVDLFSSAAASNFDQIFRKSTFLTGATRSVAYFPNSTKPRGQLLTAFEDITVPLANAPFSDLNERPCRRN
jgi:hypothetical protein